MIVFPNVSPVGKFVTPHRPSCAQHRRPASGSKHAVTWPTIMHEGDGYYGHLSESVCPENTSDFGMKQCGAAMATEQEAFCNSILLTCYLISFSARPFVGSGLCKLIVTMCKVDSAARSAQLIVRFTKSGLQGDDIHRT